MTGTAMRRRFGGSPRMSELVATGRTNTPIEALGIGRFADGAATSSDEDFE